MDKEKVAINGLWIGKSLSLMEQLCLKSFLACGHTFHLYAYRKINNVPEGIVLKDAAGILPQSKIFKFRRNEGKGSYACFADIFRYKLLFEEGGIWVDLDTVCLRHFDFESDYLFATEDCKGCGSKICTAIIKVPRGSEFIRESYKEACDMDVNSLTWNQTNSDLLSLKVEKFNLGQYLVPTVTFCPVPWWEFKKFIDPEFKVEISEETYAIHLWHEMWRRENPLPKRLRGLICGISPLSTDAIFSPLTLYGNLQKRYL